MNRGSRRLRQQATTLHTALNKTDENWYFVLPPPSKQAPRFRLPGLSISIYILLSGFRLPSNSRRVVSGSVPCVAALLLLRCCWAVIYTAVVSCRLLARPTTPHPTPHTPPRPRAPRRAPPRPAARPPRGPRSSSSEAMASSCTGTGTSSTTRTSTRTRSRRAPAPGPVPAPARVPCCFVLLPLLGNGGARLHLPETTW